MSSATTSSSSFFSSPLSSPTASSSGLIEPSRLAAYLASINIPAADHAAIEDAAAAALRAELAGDDALAAKLEDWTQANARIDEAGKAMAKAAKKIVRAEKKIAEAERVMAELQVWADGLARREEALEASTKKMDQVADGRAAAAPARAKTARGDKAKKQPAADAPTGKGKAATKAEAASTKSKQAKTAASTAPAEAPPARTTRARSAAVEATTAQNRPTKTKPAAKDVKATKRAAAAPVPAAAAPKPAQKPIIRDDDFLAKMVEGGKVEFARQPKEKAENAAAERKAKAAKAAGERAQKAAEEKRKAKEVEEHGPRKTGDAIYDMVMKGQWLKEQARKKVAEEARAKKKAQHVEAAGKGESSDAKPMARSRKRRVEETAEEDLLPDTRKSKDAKGERRRLLAELRAKRADREKEPVPGEPERKRAKTGGVSAGQEMKEIKTAAVLADRVTVKRMAKTGHAPAGQETAEKKRKAPARAEEDSEDDKEETRPRPKKRLVSREGYPVTVLEKAERKLGEERNVDKATKPTEDLPAAPAQSKDNGSDEAAPAKAEKARRVTPPPTRTTRSQLKQADAAIADVAPPDDNAATKQPAWTDPAIDFLADTDDDEETPSLWMPAPKAKKGGRKPAQKETAAGKGGQRAPKKDGEPRQATDKKQAAAAATTAGKKTDPEEAAAAEHKSTPHPSAPAAASKRKRGEEVAEPALKRARLSPEGDGGLAHSVSPRALPAPVATDAEELGPLDAPPTPCTTWNDRVGSSPEVGSPEPAHDEDDHKEHSPQPAKRARVESPEEGEIVE